MHASVKTDKQTLFCFIVHYSTDLLPYAPAVADSRGRMAITRQAVITIMPDVSPRIIEHVKMAARQAGRQALDKQGADTNTAR